MAENWIQGMNRCTGPGVCHCSIVTGHDPDNRYCPRNNTEAYRRIVEEWPHGAPTTADGVKTLDGEQHGS